MRRRLSRPAGALTVAVAGALALGGCGQSDVERYSQTWDHGCQDVAAAYRTFRTAVSAAAGSPNPSTTALGTPARALVADLEGPYRDLREADPPAKWAAWNRTAVRRLDATRRVVDDGVRRLAAGDDAAVGQIAPGALGPAAPDAPADLQSRTPSCSRLP